MSDSSTSTTRAQRLAGYLAMDPDNTQLLRDHAREAAKDGDLSAALSSLNRLCTFADAIPDDASLQIAVLRADHQLQQALDAATRAAMRWPDDQTVLIEFAKTLLLARQFEQVLALLQAATDRGPSGGAAALEVQALHHLGRLDEAERKIDDLLAQGEPGPALMGVAIPVLQDQFRTREAAAMARQLAQHAAHAYPAWEALATEALEQNQLPNAIAFVDRALATRQDDGRIWLLGGLAHWQAQHMTEAQGALERALTLMPDHAGSWLAMGWIQLLQEQLVQARASFDHALQASPDFSECHGSLAVLAVLEGRNDEAKTLIRKARRLDPACGSATLAEAKLQGVAPEALAEMGKRFVAGLRANPPRGQ